MKTILKAGLIAGAISLFTQNKNNTNHKAIKTNLDHTRVHNYNKSSYIKPRRNNKKKLLNTLKWSMPGDSLTLDPHAQNQGPTHMVSRQVYEGLVTPGINNSEGIYEFAASNELWRASLETIDFMPLDSVNYSGGVIVTDWYSVESNPDESIKISIRFLTNEIRSDALDIKVFNRKCLTGSNCVISKSGDGDLINELKSAILKKAENYKKEK